MELKKKMEEMKARLDSISVDGIAGEGNEKVIVTATANKDIKNIDISVELIAGGDKEHIEDLLLTAIGRAMQQAQKVSEAEARQMALSGGFSGLGI